MDAKQLAGTMMFALSVVCVAFVITGLIKALRKTGFARQSQTRIVAVTIFAIAGWMVLTGILASKGFFTNFSTPPPRVMFLIILPLPVVLRISFSKKFAAILKVVPPHWLIAMQAFRIVVELLLLKTYASGLLPKQMTFEGGNFDIISGLLAIPIAIAIARKRNPLLIKAYNIAGLLLLLNILVIAVLSMPTPLRQFMNEPANTIVVEFPFTYLPGVLVVIAYSLHIFSLRQVAVLRGELTEAKYNAKLVG